MSEISIDDLDLDPDLEADPGCSWHPRPEKTEARDDAGDMVDLDDDQVLEHQAKPEAAEQLDAGVPLEAEASATTPDGEV